MQKKNQSPGIVLKSLLEKHGMNCNRLAKAIGMSNAMVRLMVLDQSPVSLAAAFRLARFFKTTPEYWLSLQLQYDLSQAVKDKKLAKELDGIIDVHNYTFVRKPHAAKKGKGKSKGKIAEKKTTLADKRKKAGRVPGAKPARGRKK